MHVYIYGVGLSLSTWHASKLENESYKVWLSHLKGKSGTGFNLILKEIVKYFEQNGENLMKIG